ncbi:MAG TPA: GMC family oxidoreductase N-terminal domain-containing protein [Roseiarcus sp.]
MPDRFDYIVIGGGSSGCVAATRLVRDGGARVLLIERGQESQPALMQMPAGYMKYLGREDYLEMHQTVSQPQLDGRAPIVPQANLLGGGSSVNAMVYMRGQREDYDGWDALMGGGSGWFYADVLPHFKIMEHNTKLNDEFHGINGPLWISDPGRIDPLTEAFMLAAQGLGIRYNPDFNGQRQAGVGPMPHTIGRNRRCNAVGAFLSQVRRDKRLTLVTRARATRVLVERGRAVGVEYRVGGEARQAYADGEVLVAAGAYNTAKLLMLSGLGPADHLRELGVPIACDLPGVGQNLQDHHEVPVISTLRNPGGYYGQDRGWRMLRNGLEYLLFKSGPVATTGVEACAFVDPDGSVRPTIQLYCVPTVYLDRDIKDVKATHGVTLTPCLLRPKARGSVRLRSADPGDKPLVDSNFFGHPDDLRLTIAAMRLARRVLDEEPLHSLVGEELLPGSGCVDDADLEPYAKRMVKTNYHPVGTARMGPDGDPAAVLDSRLRLRGVGALRVIDCSAIPRIVSGNTNAAALMLGDRAATFILNSR